MRKYPLFVLAAAAAMSIASVPMTAHAAAFQVTGGGNGMSGYMTNCSGQTGNLAGIFNQLSATANGRGSCNEYRKCTNDGSRSGLSGNRRWKWHEWLYDKLQRADRQFGRHIQSAECNC